jgi:hypothetical protein
MLANFSVHITTIQSLKRINQQEHIHFMRNAATRIEGKIDNVQETVNEGFQVCFFVMWILRYLIFLLESDDEIRCER